MKTALFPVLCSLAVSCAAAAEVGGIDAPLVDEKIRQLMQDRNYAEAVKAIDAAQAVKDAAGDYLAYLKGRALYLQDQFDQATAVFDQIQKDFPKSEWARRARFAKAVALARKGDFRSAELVIRAEAEYLLSDDRKQQIADIYLQFANDCFKPPKEEQKPDYQKALDFYQKALEVGPKAERRPEIELLVAQCRQHLGKHGEAAAAYEQFIKDYGSPDASPSAPAPAAGAKPALPGAPRANALLEIEARYRLGECRLAEGNLKQARRVWQDLLAKYVDLPHDRVADAQFQLSRTWRVPQPGSDEELSLGVAALEAFIERFPKHKLAAQAHLEVAQSYIHRGRFEDAATALKRFLADPRHQERPEIPDARNLLGRSYQLQKKFAEALSTWQDYLGKHPTHKDWSAVQRQIIDTEYLMACDKLDAKDFEAANKLFAEFLAKYPLDPRHPNILLLMNRKPYHEEKWDEAIAGWRRIVSKYPQTNEASLAQFSIADTLEHKLGKLEEALEEYRKVTWGNAAPRAQQAISRLTARSMSVATERVFRSHEVPRLKLLTRNIESVTVRAYKVDLETYFRKMHLARGVEGLDIALIDPDKTFEFKVPKYAKYQQIESQVEVPLPREATSGVMAVTVSSKTLEATSLVIQSDLDVIVKSSRDELFVFAENMRTGKPWPEVRLLVSNGAQVLAEAVTGKDGVFQKSFKDLLASQPSPQPGAARGSLEAADVRVFAVTDAHVASNIVGLQGVGVAQGLTDKGYVYTDRPAYRAGQLVHLRGCIRRAANDAYTIEKDKKYTVEVFDSRARLVRQQDVTLNEFGSFHAHLLLPVTSPQGQYRVSVREVAGKVFQGTFLVHEYQLEPVRLVVDTPRRVYYRGEEIAGTIRALFYYGAPLAGREIRYQLADDRQYTATTDAKGEIKFKLPTREFGETQVLPLVVQLPERSLQSAVNFVLAAQGFSIGITTVRPVYVAGETFEARLSTRDAEGKPIAQKLMLKVLEQTTVQGKVGERQIAEHPVQTAADGTARQTLKLEKGGRYILRAEGVDRFKTPVFSQHTVQISGDEDRVRLRILSDQHTYKVGDTAAVQVHWREGPALALVTFQGARVLDYRLVELQTGSNTLKIPMTAALAPNFDLAVAVMHDVPAQAEARAKADGPQPEAEGKAVKARFHEATSPFTVERDLRVTIVARPKAKGPAAPAGGQGEAKAPADSPRAFRPGEQVEVAITTTDPQGKPVPTELSLAMVEQALVDRYPSQVPAIHDFFRGQARQSALRTSSSITFDYRPQTQPINPRLLAEADRLEIAREEAESRKMATLEDKMERLAESVDEKSGQQQSGQQQSGQQVLSQSELTVARGGVLVVTEETDALRQNGPAITFGGSRRQSMQRYGGVARRTEEALEIRRKLAFVNPSVDINGRADGRTQMGYGFSADNRWGYVDDGGFLYCQDFRALDGPKSLANSGGQVTILNGTGAITNFFLGKDVEGRAKALEAISAELARPGSVLVSPTATEETGYWNPGIITGKDGTATMTLVMPEQSTGWRLEAKGITAETLAGESTLDVAAKKDLFGALKLPLAFTDGDEAEVVASIHNDAIEKGQLTVTLKTTINGRSVVEKKMLDVAAKGLHEVTFKTSLDGRRQQKEHQGPAEQAAAVELALTIAAGDRQDTLRRSVPLKPYGMPVFATASGSASSDTTAFVEPPKNIPLEGPSLEILIGPSVRRSLLDILLGPAPLCQVEVHRIASGLDTATSDLMAALALQKLLGASRDAGSPEAQAVDNRARGSIALLVSSQNDDGSWSWTGRGGAGNRYTSARVVWALSLARTAGYTVPDDGYQKALSYLRNQVAATDNSDYETKAILLHALSTAGQGDFALANRLYRERPALSTAALAYTALAFAQMDRKATAEELLTLLAQRNLDEAVSRRQAAHGSLPWSHAPAELRALLALGLEQVSPKAPKVKELVDWLLANRAGHRWSPDKATGPAALALGQWFAEVRFEGERYKLAVFVNDVQAKVIDVDPAAGSQVVEVPARLLKKEGRQRINFQLTGRGQYTYQCILSGFVPADKLRSTTQDWEITRTYEPAPLEMDGREVPRGFDVVEGSYTSFKNPLGQLPIGRRGLVELHVWRKTPYNTPEAQLEYLVVTEPIPCGATVIEKSVRGPFERFEVAPGAITFYIGSRAQVGTIQYELYGYLPGKYRAAPSVIRNAHRPDQLAVAVAKSLEILPSGVASSDKYRLTPRELYELGKRLFQKTSLGGPVQDAAQADAWKVAAGHLAELIKTWNLRTEVYKDAVRMLLDIHLSIGPPAQVVRHFEIIKEKWPTEEIPFAKIIKVGAAYHEMGEYERSYLIFRATVESSFARESRVAGFLQSQGEFLRSVEVMGRLLREYPPEPYIAAATYALAQQVYAKAPQAAADPKLRQQKVNRVDLIDRAWGMLEGFLTAWPEDPAADQAAFSAASALLEMKEYARAAARCNQYARRYPKSDLLDSFWYMIGYCRFATGEHQAALEMCRKVAEHLRTDRSSGRQVESPNKWQAVYILGQIHHSLGAAAEAVREYRRVEDRFSDAREAIAYFLRKAIDLPEVTMIKPGEPADVELKFRNVASCDVKVYRIDLMKFSLLKRNLGGITQINLAGIRPQHEATVALGDGKDYRDRTHKLQLPLKDEGAYLVVCRGEDLHASGLVLVTPLAVEVQEQADAGRVRTTVKNTAADRYLHNVHVKVIGSRNEDFVSGETDLRGVFVADGIRGTSTVIAQADAGRYAFFRGRMDLAPAAADPSAPAKRPSGSGKAAPAARPEAALEGDLLKNLKSTNEMLQGKQVDQLQQMFQKEQKGVEAQKAF